MVYIVYIVKMLCCSLGLYPLYANKDIKYLVKQTN